MNGDNEDDGDDRKKIYILIAILKVLETVLYFMPLISTILN